MSFFVPAQQLAICIAQELNRAEPDLREIALDRLGVLSGDYVELIAGHLADPDPEVRGSAAINLGRVRRSGAWAHLIRASYTEASDEVQRHIVAALGLYHDDAILLRLLDLLTRRDGDYRVRMEVAVQLWRYSPELVAPALVELVRNDDEDIVRVHAAESLEMLDEIGPSSGAFRTLWLELVEEGSVGLATVAERALRRETVEPVTDILAVIMRRLRHPAAAERSFALHRLSMLAPALAVALARPLLEDEEAEVRTACCECLGALREEAAIPLLVAALRAGPVTGVHAAALIGLENYHTSEVGGILLDLLEKGTCAGASLSILCRQLWKYPSSRSAELLRQVLASRVEMPHRSIVESSLALLARCLSLGDP